MKPRFILCLFTLFFVTRSVNAGEEAKSLFNGKDLSGWVIENEGQFSVRDGLLHVNRGTGWLRSIKQFTDITLTYEVRFLEAKANSGVFVRTAPTSHTD